MNTNRTECEQCGKEYDPHEPMATETMCANCEQSRAEAAFERVYSLGDDGPAERAHRDDQHRGLK